MTLTDAGPLIAIIDADEPDHEACLKALDHLALPLVTTWPAFTVAMYLLGRAGGLLGQRTPAGSFRADAWLSKICRRRLSSAAHG